MLRDQPIDFEFQSQDLPLLPGAKSYAESGFAPGGTNRNRESFESMVDFGSECEAWYSDIIFDPQTSGGLLIAIDDSENKARSLIEDLASKGVEAVQVGRVVEGEGRLRLL